MSATDQNDNEATPSIDIPAARETPPEDDGNTASLDFSQGYTSSWAIGKLRSVLQLMASPLTDETGSTRSVIAGLATIAIAGTFVGLVAPANDALSPSYRKISASLGYIYFMAWSVSFYPQVISNFKRKSTVGLSPDFVVLNVIGFACYTAYNAAFYWNHSIQEMYKERFGPGAEITVQSNDVAFAIHALVLSVITLVQILYYSTTASGSTVRLSRPVLFVILGISILCAGYPLLVVLGPHSAPGYYDGNSNTMGKFNWLDFLYLLSYIKIFISTIKYIPQVFLNIRRKSTVGWSIWNILLDLTGGTLSDLQLVLDCADMKDFSGITHNKAKLALGSLSIVFDLIFLAQHYCLYPGAITTGNEEQREPLLQPLVEENNRTENEGDDEDETSSGPRTIFV